MFTVAQTHVSDRKYVFSVRLTRRDPIHDIKDAAVPHIFWNPKVLYRIQKCPPPVPILSQLDPVHTPTSHFLKIHLNIILKSTPESPNRSPFLRLNNVHYVYIFVKLCQFVGFSYQI